MYFPFGNAPFRACLQVAGLRLHNRSACPGNPTSWPCLNDHHHCKEPLEDAIHVRNAIARFNQVEDVTDKERDEAWERIRTAARKFDVELGEGGWRELGTDKHHKR